MTHGCKRSGGFVDSGCTANCDCHDTQRIEPPQADDEQVLTPYGIIDPDYARVFSMARCLAWSEGYALLFHGSFTRDLDLIAVPWTVSACEPEHLMRRIATAADLRCLDDEPGKKEHGRLAWTLVFKAFGDPRFIDLSAMPRSAVGAKVSRQEVSDLIEKHCYVASAGDDYYVSGVEQAADEIARRSTALTGNDSKGGAA